jgi:hypothetical protein
MDRVVLGIAFLAFYVWLCWPFFKRFFDRKRTHRVFALAAWRARRGAKHRAEGEARKVATPKGERPK